MKKTYCLLLIVFIMCSCLLINNSNAQKIKGRVFNDLNRNGLFDPKEQGISGVPVSNQKDVVLSDQDGRYQLDVGEQGVIFISKPSGYKFKLNELNTPLFYYIHQPQGSPKFKYEGVKPTGELPENVDFALYQTVETDTFEVVVFADPQPRSKKEIDYIRDDVVTELVGTSARLGLVLGDVMYDDLSIFPEYRQVIAQLGIPFFHAPGNHDMNYEAADDGNALETFKHHFGPSYYSFNYGQVHFIVLDDVEWLNRGQEKPHYHGMLGQKQLTWLANDLKYVADNKLIVFLMHIPLYTFLSTHESVNVLDRQKLFELIKNRQYLLALAGHMHLIEHQYLGTEQGWQGADPLHQITCGTVSGTWWSGPPDERGIPTTDQRDGVPNGYHIFTFNGNQYWERYKAAGKDHDYQLRISYPSRTVKLEHLSDSLIVVNVFNGNSRSKVEYRVDEGPYQKLDQEIRTDPYFENLYENYVQTYADWIEPRRANHIWTGQLPADLQTGVHTIEVRTTDAYGQIHRGAQIFEVVK